MGLDRAMGLLVLAAVDLQSTVEKSTILSLDGSTSRLPSGTWKRSVFFPRGTSVPGEQTNFFAASPAP